MDKSSMAMIMSIAVKGKSKIRSPFCPLRNMPIFAHTVGPRLSGHQLSGYLYYPAMILQYILSIFN